MTFTTTLDEFTAEALAEEFYATYGFYPEDMDTLQAMAEGADPSERYVRESEMSDSEDDDSAAHDEWHERLMEHVRDEVWAGE